MRALCGLPCAALPGGRFPAAKWRTIEAARGLGVEIRQARGQGGTRFEFAIRTTPPETQAALEPSLAGLPAICERQDIGDLLRAFPRLTSNQRRSADDRAQRLDDVEREIADGATLARAAAARGIDERTVRRDRRRVRGLPRHAWSAALASCRERRQADPAWLRPLLRLYRLPSKPSLADAIEQLARELPEGAALPSYDQARRYLAGMSAVECARGRLGPNALKGVRACKRRTVDGLRPGDVYIADGHTFDAEVAHPDGGQACRPEVTSVLDVCTRFWCGWSVALAESALAVADALRHAVQSHGIPAIYYADRGPGQEARVVEQMLDRLGITRERSIARNSQARGVIEAFNKRLIAIGKRLPSYMGRDMDADAKRIVHLRSRRELRTVGTSGLLLPWDRFLALIEDAQRAYNQRPHSALPKIVDPATGKMRHQAPAEAWAAALERGWTPVMLEPHQLDDIARPQEVRITRRGEVRLHSKRYFAKALEHFDGAEILAGYDVHDASRIWVRDLDERLLAVAELDANSVPYFSESRVQQAREARARGRARRLEARLEGVRQELAGPRLAMVASGEPQPPAGISAWGAEQRAGLRAEIERSAANPRPAEPWIASVLATAAIEGGETPKAPANPPLSKSDGARAHALWKRRLAGEELSAADAAFLDRRLDALVDREFTRLSRRQARRDKAPAPAERSSRTAPRLYPLLELTGGEDDEFYSRARWLERRQEAGETLAREDGLWLAEAQHSTWYTSLRRIEALNARFWSRRAG